MGPYDHFPYLTGDRLIIRKMEESDVDALNEITENAHVYRYIPPFLYRKSRGNLLAAIRNLGSRDFEKKKRIGAGVYLRNEPRHLVGLAEMFDYKKRAGQMTLGYKINEKYWHNGIATEAVALMMSYLCDACDVRMLKAFVMPDNIYSQRVLLKNGFVKESKLTGCSGWGFTETGTLYEFGYSPHAE